MAAEVLRSPAFLPPRETLAITSRASQILKSLQPGFLALPYPLSLLTTAESPERWQSYENLLVACLKSGDDKTALQCLSELNTRFGEDNEKVLALKGMYKESQAASDGDVERILTEYEEILKDHPEYMLVRKRRVALLKSTGRISDAVKGLVKILDASPTDAESWAELAEVYRELGSYERSVYAWEEVLLVMPYAWNVHARLGEVELQWAGSVNGDKDKLKVTSSSLRRYSRAIELCDNYLRGYYGLYLTSTRLLHLLNKNQKAAAAELIGDPSPPPIPAVESLKELAAEKLGEMVRRGGSREAGWDGYDAAELDAARELLARDTQALQR